MLYNHFTEELLGLQGVKITNVEQEKNLIIHLEMERKRHNCICCGTATDTIHDYRLQKIKDIPSFGKNVVIMLRKRRYRCPHCGKRFYEENPFLPGYHRMTNRLVKFVLNRLTDERSFTSVAREVNLSVSTIIRIFDLVSYPKAELPKVLSIDEFKGNTWGEKYQCILTDPENKIVLDILPERYKPHFTYIFSYATKQRTSSCLLANCLHSISHFNSLPQLLTKSLKKSSIHKVKFLMNTRYVLGRHTDSGNSYFSRLCLWYFPQIESREIFCVAPIININIISRYSILY